MKLIHYSGDVVYEDFMVIPERHPRKPWSRDEWLGMGEFIVWLKENIVAIRQRLTDVLWADNHVEQYRTKDVEIPPATSWMRCPLPFVVKSGALIDRDGNPAILSLTINLVFTPDGIEVWQAGQDHWWFRLITE